MNVQTKLIYMFSISVTHGLHYISVCTDLSHSDNIVAQIIHHWLPESIIFHINICL